MPSPHLPQAAFIGIVRDTVVKYDNPFEPAISAFDGSDFRRSCLIRMRWAGLWKTPGH